MGGTPQGSSFGRRGRIPKETACPVHDRPEDPCFGAKRRSNRTHASIRRPYGNRGCAAREIRDDEGFLWRLSFSDFFPRRKEIGPPEAPCR